MQPGSVKAVVVANARWLVALCLSSLALSACSPSSDGPLSLGGYGNTLVPQGAAPYFVVDACLEGDPQAVTLTDVEAVRVSGTKEPISFRVAWADGPAFPRVISSHEPLPDAYVPVEGARGDVGVCGRSPDRYAALAVAFPPTKRAPISVRDLRVTYEVSGDVYTEVVDVSLTQCPERTRPLKSGMGCTLSGTHG